MKIIILMILLISQFAMADNHTIITQSSQSFNGNEWTKNQLNIIRTVLKCSKIMNNSKHDFLQEPLCDTNSLIEKTNESIKQINLGFEPYRYDKNIIRFLNTEFYNPIETIEAIASIETAVYGIYTFTVILDENNSFVQYDKFIEV